MTNEEAIRLWHAARAELRAAFDLFDLDRDGGLDIVELRSALRVLGHDVGYTEVHQLIAAVCGQPDGLVDFDQFVQMVEPRPEGLDPEADLREAFHILDLDGDGRISRTELREAFRRHDPEGATQEADRVINALDDTDTLGFDEFRALVAGVE